MHIEVLAYGSPEQHKNIVKDINTWKYKIEGKTFSGEMSPFISEIKLYDIRIPEELAPQLITDLGIRQFESPVNMKKTWKNKFIYLIQKMVLKLLGSKHIEPAKERKYQPDGWFYCFPLGNYVDNKVKEPFTGKEKEVL